MAYQIGFDLYESATQQFLQRVQSALRVTAPLPIPASPPGSSNTGTTETESKTDDEKMETEESGKVVSGDSWHSINSKLMTFIINFSFSVHNCSAASNF